MKKFIFIIIVFCIGFTTQAQVNVDAELRPRLELRNGYAQLKSEIDEMAYFVTQRTRINTRYASDYLQVYLSLQNIRTWGDVSLMSSRDNNGIGVHQAWASLKSGEYSKFKFGRQVLNYDDARFLGEANWAQQARSHDALLYMYDKSDLNLHLGAAINQGRPSIYRSVYTVSKNYKYMQYMWLHKEFSRLSASMLFLNSGMQFIDQEDATKNEIRHNQTIGLHLKSKTPKIGFKSNLYYQLGKDVLDRDLSAFLCSVEGSYKLSSTTNLFLGAELQSGSNYKTDQQVNNSFTPFYGTNRKYNGFMNYFYVGGNHVNSVGLLDVHAKAKFNIKEKSKLYVALHNFSSAVEFEQDKSKQLGSELDISYSYDYKKDVSFNIGYSHLFPSEGLALLRNGTKDNTNNLFWFMVTVKPSLFSSSK